MNQTTTRKLDQLKAEYENKVQMLWDAYTRGAMSLKDLDDRCAALWDDFNKKIVAVRDDDTEAAGGAR